MARTCRPPVTTTPRPQTAHLLTQTNTAASPSSSHRSTFFHETEVTMTSGTDGTASSHHGWGGRSMSVSYTLHHPHRVDAHMTTASASTSTGHNRERDLEQANDPSIRSSGHISSSASKHARASNDNRNESRRDDGRSHDHRDNRDRGRESSAGGNREYSSRDSRSYHYQRDYRENVAGNRNHRDYSSKDSRSYSDRNDYYSRDRGLYSSNNYSRSSRDRNSWNYYSSSDRNSHHRPDADYSRRDDGRNHHHSSREWKTEYTTRDDQYHSSRERNTTIRQDSRRSHNSNHYRDSGHETKRPRTAQNSNIDHLKIERDAHRLEAQKTEARLRKAQAEREIMEQNLKLEEAKRQLEIVRSQPMVAEREEGPFAGVGVGGGANLPVLSAFVDATTRGHGLEAVVSRTNLTVPSVAAAASSSNTPEASDSDARNSTNNDPSFVSESFDAEESQDDLLLSISASRPKAHGKAKQSTKSKKKKKSSPKKTPRRRPEKCSDDKKRSDTGAEKRTLSIYTEVDMMSTYTPIIVDHSLARKKFLVQWNKNDGSSETPCMSWMGFENFLFPDIANNYIDKKVEEDRYSKLATYKDSFPEVVDLGEFDEEEPDLCELDFCCFICKCNDKGVTRSARNCKDARKYHRLCCHGLKLTDDLEDFVCAAGKALMEVLEPPQDDDGSDLENEGVELEMSRVEESDDGSETKCSAVIISSLVRSRQQPTHAGDAAVVLSINTGIGGVAVAIKQGSFKTKRIIHVEDDLVAQHVIRFHHDFKYGNLEKDDGIEHIVGLYNTLDEVRADPEDLVRRFGPIDLIICASSGKTNQEHENYADRFFTLCDHVRRYNDDIHQHNSLFYMLETLPKDHVDLQKHSYCTCDSRGDYDCKRTLICNWPLETAIPTLRGLESSQQKENVAELETTLGFPNQYATSSVAALFSELKTALTVGFVQKKWSDEVHPKYWGFLGMGPSGYSFKVNRKTVADFPLDMLLLLIKDSVSSQHLCDVDYAKQLLTRSTSVRWLLGMLQPLAQHFDKTEFGDVDSLAEVASHDAVEVVVKTEFNEDPQHDTGVETDLCIVCEDAKKKIMILPCKHMCLCEKCANFDVIKDCPMCRTKVEDSSEVFW
ncbi:hypothetical protein ACHAW6_013022 [Cyclotella cf. meneghiniana]